MNKFRMLAIVGSLILGLSPAASANAEGETPLQQEIDQVLANTEGGVQISQNEIAWDGGDAIMSFPLPGETQAPVSSPAAQRLQAKAAGKPAGTVEPASTPGDVTILGSTDSCPTQVFGNDWYCFYQHPNYGGHRLQWNATHKSPVYFSKYDFANETSSWVNNGAKKIRVFDDYWVNNPTELWNEYGHDSSTFVGSYWGDRADYFITN
ncbi:peptidase inhibitor family I36 protein (plasmid) [Streptomyces laculatispora]|uniref:Peptidase inhibitor family I36 protein n=1 Tax=Streptomyces laculatispora TaxID=887464 RepID=A0ABY9II16_9ACTN|nr:peptidase inhibitor family I36 protein [Streptomyces laculatispora]WLQ45628.1 peptidase inhibitor family I36 protein [Streptomyces laculatispora]